MRIKIQSSILSECNLAPDLVFINPVLFAAEWNEKRGLGGLFSDLTERVRSRKGSDRLNFIQIKEESIRLVLREELLLKLKLEQTAVLKKGNTADLDMVLRCQRMVLPLVEWFHQNARVLRWRSEPKPYYVWVSEIMLQQTRVEAVKGYFDRFVEALPDISALAECPEEKLLKLWEGLGYYNRVRNLQKAAKQVMEQYEGELPSSYQTLQQLPGIGSYTAGAIASIAYGKPAPAVDGNVLRVLKRVTGSRDDITKPSVKKEAEQLFSCLSKQAYQKDIRPGDFNQALMELGATVCLPNGEPLCSQCPLEHLCRIAGEENWKEIPVKPVKKKRRIEERTVFVLRGEAGQIGICKRPEAGLLAGLWELPNIEGTLSEEEAELFLQNSFGVEPLEIVKLGKAKHIFSHVEWRMIGYAVKIGSLLSLPSLQMVSEQELEEIYSLPSAFEAYRPNSKKEEKLEKEEEKKEKKEDENVRNLKIRKKELENNNKAGGKN